MQQVSGAHRCLVLDELRDLCGSSLGVLGSLLEGSCSGLDGGRGGGLGLGSSGGQGFARSLGGCDDSGLDLGGLGSSRIGSGLHNNK